ncbi:MAG: hypothetical protein ACWA6U_11830 [Breznakibacter sp.]
MLLCASNLFSQQLDQIGKKDAVRINGGVSVNQVYRTNATAGTDPYSVVMTGNVAGSIYGLSIPLSFTWSNYKWSYTQPFNQFSLSPSYKWATLHLGSSSMSFSPYSLSGHSFIGAGIDLAPPGKWKFSAMYGQLRKELAGDSARGFDPQYRRTGTGFKTNYQFKLGEVGVHLFYAQDDTHKPVASIDSMGITPMENIVVGTSLLLRPIQQITFRGEMSTSSVSNDRRISGATEGNGAATFRYHAFKSDLTWNTRLGSLGAGFEYVEPGYQTLGAYYTVNDFINYTLNAGTAILNGKVTMAGSVGIRQTNLDHQSDTDQKDVIKNLNIGFNPGESFNLNLSYSNFYNFTHIRTIFDETNTHTEYELKDTIRFTQINESINLSTTWQVKKSETNKHTLNGNLNFQQASQNQSDAIENADTRFVNLSGGYMWMRPQQDLSLGLNINYSRNNTPGALGEALGPILSARKSHFNKTLRNNLSLSWNGTYTNHRSTGNIITARWGSNYTLMKKHMLNLSMAYSQRQRSGNSTSYLTATLGYSYQFGWPKADLKKD